VLAKGPGVRKSALRCSVSRVAVCGCENPQWSALQFGLLRRVDSYHSTMMYLPIEYADRIRKWQ
jgi:hypothetical protein